MEIVIDEITKFHTPREEFLCYRSSTEALGNPSKR
jgi:hypothetical protein